MSGRYELSSTKIPGRLVIFDGVSDDQVERLAKVIRQCDPDMIDPDAPGAVNMLLDIAKPQDSPIHDCFEWDDSKAGFRYRVAQAHVYLRLIVLKDKPPAPRGRSTAKPKPRKLQVIQEEPEEVDYVPAHYASGLSSAVVERKLIKELAELFGLARNHGFARNDPRWARMLTAFEDIQRTVCSA